MGAVCILENSHDGVPVVILVGEPGFAGALIVIATEMPLFGQPEVILELGSKSREGIRPPVMKWRPIQL